MHIMFHQISRPYLHRIQLDHSPLAVLVHICLG